MAIADLKRQFSDLFDRIGPDPLPPRYPLVSIEIAPDRVTAVRMGAIGKSGKMKLDAIQSRPIPDGAIEVSLTKPNILDTGAVSAAVKEVLHQLDSRDHRISVLLPDDVARVALLGFATLPKTRRELTELVRFRMAKSLPFKPEEAEMDLMILNGGTARPGASAATVLASFVHSDVVEQYEGLLADCGYWPGLVSLSTFELYNLFRPRFAERKLPDKDSLVLNVTRHYLSVLILRDTDVIFYRCKPHVSAAAGSDPLADVRREVYTSLAFYQEKLLGRGIGRVFLRSVSLPLDGIREAVSAEAGGELEVLDPLPLLPQNGGPLLGSEDAAVAAPALGAILGRRP
jgi:Tfp pilus assembly PilM family ATPase